MLILLVVFDLNFDVFKGIYEVWVNVDDGVLLGCEFELVEILCFIKQENIQNVVWVMVDVYYVQVMYYYLLCVKFMEFKLFWEFVGGLINVGIFGLNEVDLIFGLDLCYISIFKDNLQNQLFVVLQQYYGCVKIDFSMCMMYVLFYDFDGKLLWEVKFDFELQLVLFVVQWEWM